MKYYVHSTGRNGRPSGLLKKKKKNINYPSKDEAQTALFKAPVRTAL